MIGRQLRQDPEFSPARSLPNDILRQVEILERIEAQSVMDRAPRTQRGETQSLCIAGAPEDDSDRD